MAKLSQNPAKMKFKMGGGYVTKKGDKKGKFINGKSEIWRESPSNPPALKGIHGITKVFLDPATTDDCVIKEADIVFKAQQRNPTAFSRTSSRFIAT
jgi:hypothetical protein